MAWIIWYFQCFLLPTLTRDRPYHQNKSLRTTRWRLWWWLLSRGFLRDRYSWQRWELHCSILNSWHGIWRCFSSSPPYAPSSSESFLLQGFHRTSSANHNLAGREVMREDRRMQRCRTANQHAIGIYVVYDRCHNIVFPKSMLESPRYSRLVPAVVQNYPGDSGDEQVVKAVSLDM